MRQRGRTDARAGKVDAVMSSPAKTGNPRVLYTAISQGHLCVFHRPVLKHLRARGYCVHVVANPSPGFQLDEADRVTDVQFGRNPFSLQNLSALRSLIRLVRADTFALLHCHTPVASALARVAALFVKGPKPVVVYTAHGFHFYPGAPWSSWLLWFSLEWWLTRITDVLVVINRWDERAAQRFLRAKRVFRIPGMGVDLERFKPATDAGRLKVRQALRIDADSLVVLYVAELIPRKNHGLVIEALPDILQVVPNTIVLFAGDGPLEDVYKAQCETLGIASNVRFLGFRPDVDALCRAADIAVSASRHEGLGIGVAEAMASGLPVVASEDRGHRELVAPGENGWLFGQNDRDAFVRFVLALASDAEMRKRYGARGRERVAAFSVTASVQSLSGVYDAAEALARDRGLM